MSSTLKKSLLYSVFWSMIGQIGAMGMNLISNIAIARVLSPVEFGQVGIIMVFITLSSVLTDSGLSGALIRLKEVNKDDFSTVFVFNLLVSLACYIILIVFGGLISEYYKDPILKSLLYFSGIIIFINAFNITQNTQLFREMEFKTTSMFRFISTFIGCFFGVTLAYSGYGVWSLIYMQVIIAAINTILLIFKRGFYFSLKFNKSSFNSLYGFGVNTTLASLLNTAFDNIYQLIFSKIFSMHQAGLFYQAKKLQEVPSNIINLAIQNVVFSFLSKLQDDKKEFILVYNKIMILLTILMGVITSFIFIYANQIITTLYGDKWIGSVFIMKLLCIASFFYLQEMFNRIIFKVFNKTKQILFLEIIKKGIQALSVILGIFMKDINILLFGFVITSIVSYVINFYYSRKILGNVVWHELIIIGKVILVGIFTVISYFVIISYLNINGNAVFFAAPLFLFLFLFLTKLFGVANVLKEFEMIRKIIKNNAK